MENVMTPPIERVPRRERLAAYARFIKIEHTLFSLPLLFAGAVLADGRWPSWRTTYLILLAGAGARTLAMTLNRIMDWRIDARNPRTAGRELPRGSLSLMDAALVGVASLLAYLWAAMSLSDFCFMWSWVPVLLFALYPTLKRFTWFCHFGLGITWAMAPLGGWFAVKPGFQGAWPAFLLGIFSFFWLSGFDVIYATMDEEFDRAEGLFSLPARVGSVWALRISAALHWCAFLSLAVLYATSLAGVSAAFLMIMAGFLLLLEHLLVDHMDLAFFKLNVATGFMVLFMILIGIQAEF